MKNLANNRVLVIDDCLDIHEDFKSILASKSTTSSVLDSFEKNLLGSAQTAAPSQAAGFELVHAYQGEEGVRMLAEANASGLPFVAVFVDMRMPPGWDGLKTIREIRRQDKETSLVVCTAYSDHALQDIASDVGDLDKLLVLKKPFDTVEVLSIAQSLRERWALLQRSQLRMNELEDLVGERTAQLQAERAKDKLRLEELEEIVQKRTAELRKIAHFDKLTTLPNRAMFYDRLQTAVQRGKMEPARQFSLMFIDFDRFKVINDSLGHEYGDKLLIEIGRRLRQATQSSEFVAENEENCIAARLGGDEFCVLIDSMQHEDDVCRFARRLLDQLSVPYHLGGHEIVSTASIGITFSSLGYQSCEDMMRDADIAMYRAKMQGKAQFVVFDPTMHQQAVHRMVMEIDLRSAIARNELCLQYQPIISLHTGEIAGAEALVRWKHPKRGMILPADFIPVAEETGEIQALGDWVIERACTLVLEWKNNPKFRPRYVSVNVSSTQISSPGFADRFKAIIQKTGADASRLVLEVTESGLMRDAETADAVLRALRETGAKVYVDDFGTGQSTLGMLRRFPVDGLKLDRSFLDKQVVSRRSAAVVHAVVTLARDMDIQLIAEGVELLEQVAMLQTLGCTEAQGYFFSEPVDLSRLENISRVRTMAA
jgi:diguanylate cyclase (GGDEF)-like protein